MSSMFPRPPLPLLKHIQHMASVMADVAATCVSVKNVGILDEKEMIEAAEELLTRMIEAGTQVRGNRGPIVAITWDDFRLPTAAALRVALEEMERTE